MISETSTHGVMLRDTRLRYADSGNTVELRYPRTLAEGRGTYSYLVTDVFHNYILPQTPLLHN